MGSLFLAYFLAAIKHVGVRRVGFERLHGNRKTGLTQQLAHVALIEIMAALKSGHKPVVDIVAPIFRARRFVDVFDNQTAVRTEFPSYFLQ